MTYDEISTQLAVFEADTDMKFNKREKHLIISFAEWLLSQNSAKPIVKRRFEFEGHFIVPDKVTSVSNVIKIKTGSYECDWEYGFEIKLVGGKIDIVVPTPKDSMGNWRLDKEDRIEAAYKKRTEFIDGLNGALRIRYCCLCWTSGTSAE